MSDYNPNNYDKYGNPQGPMFEPNDPNGKGPYVLLAILVLIGLVGGLLYFNGTPKGGNNEQASAPMSTTTTRPLPGPGAAPAAPTPAPAATPAPTNPPADTTKQ